MANVFDRHELKYLIDWKTHRAIVSEIGHFMEKDSHVDVNGNYRLLSLYYDDLEDSLYHAKIDGQKVRQKLRVRWYLSDDPGHKKAHVELKMKYVNQVIKKRLTIDSNKVDDFLDGFLHFDKACKDEKEVDIAREILYFYELLKLRPKVYVYYLREAYRGKYDPGLRITFDKNIACAPWYKGEFEPRVLEPVINPFYMVMELKFFERMPLWLINIVNSHNLVERRFSKYCYSVEHCRSLHINL